MSNIAIYNGPEDPENCIGFVRATASGFEALDTGEVPFGAFADMVEAANALLADCLGVKVRSNGGGSPYAAADEKQAPEVDRAQLETFVRVLFKHATAGNWISLRAFVEDRADLPPVRIAPVKLNGNFDGLIDRAFSNAELAARHPEPAVFCPPIATFAIRKRAKETDLAEGLVLSTECDKTAPAARAKLEAVLGPATLVVASGGEWTNPETGEVEPKLHVHHRLKAPTRAEGEHAMLKEARRLATMLVGGDRTNVSIVHPIRWPGSLHRKKEPKLCHIIACNPGAEIGLAWALMRLREAVEAEGLAPGGPSPGPAKGNGGKAKAGTGAQVAAAFAHLKPDHHLGAGIEDYPPLPFAAIKEGCGWLSHVHDTGGADQSEVLWRDSLRACMFLENGESLIHEFSNKHEGYDREATEAKFDRARSDKEGMNLGWPLCQTICDDGSEHCKTCPHLAAGKSPLNLADQAQPNWRREYEERVARRRAEQIKQNIEIGDNNDDVAELAVPLILTPEEMIERLVWIGFSGAVVDRVTFRTRKSEQATAEYAASVYYPKEEDEGEKEGEPKAKTKKSKSKPKPTPCLSIWMHSPRRTTVDALAWVPGAPQFCHPPENFDNAQTAFNMWRGIAPMPPVKNWQERCEPFVDHVGYLVPVESEWRRFMQWLAHTTQHPEVLPHTAYLMVAEKTGIGRNWMASVLVRVLRGYVAAGVSLPELLDGGFNGRLSCKLLAIVDELREGPGGKRYERAQRVKSIITEENRLINPKFGIQSIQKNCCRWLMFSNFFDALPFDNTDRRIETIANPTKPRTTEYYERLYKMLHDPSFIASVWWLLKTMDISSFKPGAHAAMNEAKERALVEMMTDVDRAVCDFRDECGTTLASRKDIERAAFDLYHTVNAAHLTHAITYAGMVNTGRRVKDALGVRHPIVIVDKAEWTVETVMAAPVGTLLGVMGKPVKK